MEGGRPKPGDAVLVKTQGKLKDGTIIDDEPSLVFNVGDYEVILTLFAYYNSKRAPLLPCEFKDRGDPYSTYDRRGGGGVVQISMKAYLGGEGVSYFRTYFFKAKKGPSLLG